MSRVSVQPCPSYERSVVEEALSAALAPFGGLGGASGFGRSIGRGTRVLIKPNFLRAAPSERAVSPHPEVLRALLALLSDLGAVVRIGDSPAFGTATSVAKVTGIAKVAAEFAVPVVEFRTPRNISSGAPNHRTLLIDREVVEAEAVLNLCKFKGHQQLGMTLAVKNLFGCVTGKRKPVWHLRLGDRDNGFGEMLVEVYRAVGPVLSICDGVVAMDGNGPGEGRARPLGLLLAAEDGVALDAVGARLVGFPPESLRVLQAARDLGVGQPAIEAIEVLGPESLDALQVDDWLLPDSLPIFFNPARIALSTAKQVALLAGLRLKADRGPAPSQGGPID